MFCDCTQGGSGALKRLFLASRRPCHFASRQTPRTSAASGAMKGTDETPLPFSTSSVLFPPKLVILRPPKKGRRTHRSVPGTRRPSLPMTVTTSSVSPMRRAKAWERLPARAVQLGDGGDLPRLPPPPSDWLFPEPLPVWSWRPMGKGFGRAPVCSALARSLISSPSWLPFAHEAAGRCAQVRARAHAASDVRAPAGHALLRGLPVRQTSDEQPEKRRRSPRQEEKGDRWSKSPQGRRGGKEGELGQDEEEKLPEAKELDNSCEPEW